jgi:hypothetical protein
VRVDTIAGLLQLDDQLDRTADQLAVQAMAVDGLTAACDRDQDVYAAQRLQDAAHRLRMLMATVGSVQAVLRSLAGDGDDLDATAELGPIRGRPHAFTYGQRQDPC